MSKLTKNAKPSSERLNSTENSRNEKYTAILNFEGTSETELSLKKGDEVEVISQDESTKKNWWKGKIGQNIGVFPKMYVVNQSKVSKSKLYKIIPKMIEFDELTLDKIIGNGGFATVYHGWWNREEVAIKVVRENTEKYYKNVGNEAKLFWFLRHPQIIALIGICYTNDQMYFVMDYARGGSLYNILKKPLTPNIIVDWAIQIAKGMKYLHGEAPIPNIIHRDLKSTNILILEEIVNGNLENKTLKITDFGLSRQDMNPTNVTTTAGTFGWIAPEVFSSCIVSKASDVWSYGVVFWELLTSSIPYKNRHPYQICVGVGQDILKLPISSSCPRLVKVLLKKCLSFSPALRPEFDRILMDLNEISVSSFVREVESFKQIQINWQEEINKIFDDNRSVTNSSTHIFSSQSFVKYNEQFSERLKKQNEELYYREKDMLERELYITLKQIELKNRDFNRDKIKTSQSKRFKLTFLKFRNIKTLDIGKPSNFRHFFGAQIETVKPQYNSLWAKQFSFSSQRLKLKTTSTPVLTEREHLEICSDYERKFNLRDGLFKALTVSLAVPYGKRTDRSIARYSWEINARKKHKHVILSSKDSLMPQSFAKKPEYVISSNEGSLMLHSSAIKLDELNLYPFNRTEKMKLTAKYSSMSSLSAEISPQQDNPPYKIMQTPSKSTLVFITNNSNKNDIRNERFTSSENNEVAINVRNCNKEYPFINNKNNNNTSLSCLHQNDCINNNNISYNNNNYYNLLSNIRGNHINKNNITTNVLLLPNHTNNNNITANPTNINNNITYNGNNNNNKSFNHTNYNNITSNRIKNNNLDANLNNDNYITYNRTNDNNLTTNRTHISYFTVNRTNNNNNIISNRTNANNITCNCTNNNNTTANRTNNNNITHNHTNDNNINSNGTNANSISSKDTNNNNIIANRTDKNYNITSNRTNNTNLTANCTYNNNLGYSVFGNQSVHDLKKM